MKKLLSISLLLAIAGSSMSAEANSKSQLFNSIVLIIDNNTDYEIHKKNSKKLYVEFKEYDKGGGSFMGIKLLPSTTYYPLGFKKLKSVKLEIGDGGDYYRVILIFENEIKNKTVYSDGDVLKAKGSPDFGVFSVYISNEKDARKLFSLVEELKRQL